MSNICKTPFGTYAPIYKEKGFWTSPANGKACIEKNWQLPDEELDDGLFENWLKKKSQSNIVIVAGSYFPDDTRLGFLDIDHDAFVNVGKVLSGNPICVRFGKKGAVIPFRYSGKLSVPKKKVISTKADFEKKDVLELFFFNCYCVVPPSIHPDTDQPYRWEGPALHEIDFQQLPLLGE
jgi:hypothetical protein